MAIDFAKTFGAPATTGAGAATPSNAKADRPQAQLWLNIGKSVHGIEDGEPYSFLSLPVGLPVDTMAEATSKARSGDHRDWTDARNGMLAQLNEIGAQLAPGESVTVALEVKLFRVNGEVAHTPSNENKFAVSIDALV